MQPIQTLIRRTAAVLGAIAALTVTGIATSQTVTLSSGGSCTYSQMTVTPNGNVNVTCATSAGPGVFGVTAPTNLATNAVTTGTAVRITRTSGSSGPVDVAFLLSGTSACTSSTSSPVTFADGDTAPKGIIVSAGATPGTCVVGITPSAGTISGTGSATITVVDGDAPVVFAFQSSVIASNVGNALTTITATRSGGPNGQWEVPFTLAGPLSASATAPLRGTLSATKFVFGPGAASSSVTYTPPTTTPASPALPSDLVLTLGAPVAGTAPAPAPAQTASLGTIQTATLTLNGPAVGCPAETSLSPLGGNGSINTLRVPSGTIVTYALPTAITGPSGVFALYETTFSVPNAPFVSEIHINKCKGLVQPTGDGCYVSSESNTLVQKIWMTATTSKLATPAAIAASGRCYAPPAQGPWYVNVRYTYASCKVTNNCGWHVVYKNSY